MDDHGSLTYGALSEQVRRLAAGLLAAGVRREERVLLLMHDCCQWPVAFLGALYAGIVPVAVNTLLTADDYAYMLQHSRAQAALVSESLLPMLQLLPLLLPLCMLTPPLPPPPLLPPAPPPPSLPGPLDDAPPLP